MKLKKIVSLALAGILAVSMLAGCGEDVTDPTPNEPTTPSATDVSTELENHLGSISRSKISFSNSTALNSALLTAVGNIGNDAIAREFIRDMADGTVVYVRPYNNAVAAATAVNLVAGDLDDILDTDTVTTAASPATAAAAINVLQPTLANYLDDSMSVVLLFAIDGRVIMDRALNQVADAIDATIAGLHVDDDEIVAADTASEIRYTYTGSAAAQTETYDEGHGMSVTFIAVQLNRTI